jgi:predicted AAA+ superfamily ATPase
MNIQRPFWQNKMEKIWSKSPIVWLAGVRRSGKTTLANSIKGAAYFNCDLPSVQEAVRNPELFFKKTNAALFVFDEIHQLPEASMLLKIGADTLKKARFLATGSSTIIASKKFKDTLSGRKRNIHFVPVLIQELADFNSSLEKRFLFGGLPPALLSPDLDREFYAEWMDSFYARDVQEIFKVEKRQPFLKALEYLIMSNGTLFEATKLGQVSGITRPTMVKYLDILETTKAISIVRPYSQNREQEIVSQPKVYAFDTGFYCYVKNILELRSEDCGLLLENLVLESFQAHNLGTDIRYWRTKQKAEIDFVLPISRDQINVIECKWREKNFDDSAIQMFRRRYPKGENWIITEDSVTRKVRQKNLVYKFINIFDLPSEIAKVSASR